MSPSSKGGQLSVEAVLVAVEGRSGRSRLRTACQRTQPVQCQCTASQSGQTQLLEDKRIAKKRTKSLYCQAGAGVKPAKGSAKRKGKSSAKQKTRGLYLIHSEQPDRVQ